MDNLIGALVRIFMKNGNIYQGFVREWTKKEILLINTNGEYFKIIAPYNIECISYLKKNEKIIKERSTKDEYPQHKPGDIDALLEMHKMKAKDDLQACGRVLKKTYSTQNVEYDNQSSVIQSYKNSFIKNK